MLRLGLTGGIGSGKSTVAGFLAAHGAAVVDADAISRSVTAPGGAAIGPIADMFGAEFIAADGSLDRPRMRQASFSDSGTRARLESIIHPMVGAETARQEMVALQEGRRCVVFDVPLLVESRRWRARVDQVLVVDCTVELQVQRVMARSAMARKEVESIISSQVSRTERLRAADLVIYNAGPTLAEIASTVAQMARRLGL